MMDWFPAVMTLIGVLIGVGIQEFRFWREREDKYQDMVFEKRLDAHQTAHYWCMKLSRLMMPHNLTRDGAIAVVVKEVREAREWIDKNELYLDKDSREKMNKFFEYVYETCLRYHNYEEEGRNINVGEETIKLLKNVGPLLASIERGIGVKYLPAKKISSENVEVEKLLDEMVEKMEEVMRKRER